MKQQNFAKRTRPIGMKQKVLEKTAYLVAWNTNFFTE